MEADYSSMNKEIIELPSIFTAAIAADTPETPIEI
jgi:hypothetical protein